MRPTRSTLRFLVLPILVSACAVHIPLGPGMSPENRERLRETGARHRGTVELADGRKTPTHGLSLEGDTVLWNTGSARCAVPLDQIARIRLVDHNTGAAQGLLAGLGMVALGAGVGGVVAFQSDTDLGVLPVLGGAMLGGLVGVPFGLAIGTGIGQRTIFEATPSPPAPAHAPPPGDASPTTPRDGC